MGTFNDSNVYILGAGVSAGAVVPTGLCFCHRLTAVGGKSAAMLMIR